MKRLRVLLVLAALAVLVCAGLVGAILAQLRPEAAAPEIARTRAPARIVRNVEADVGCVVDVTVRAASEGEAPGAPIPTATVTLVSGAFNPTDDWTAAPALDADGAARVDVPCGFVGVRAQAPGWAPGDMRYTEVDAAAPAVLVLELEPGVRVYGTITDEDGAPVPDAGVRAYGLTVATAGDDSAWEAWIAPTRTYLEASAFGYEEAGQAWEPDENPDPAGERLDFVLARRHDVRVWCAGLPDDDCGDVPLRCTNPWSPIGDLCQHDNATSETLCRCPAGEVAVRGAGRAVLVGADESEAWLDFRDAGRIVGRVLVQGAPSQACEVFGIRVPTALEDLPRGLVAARRTRCEADGTFVLDGLVEGDWEVAVEADTEQEELSRVLVPRRVRPREEVDVGDIRLPGGGEIEGVLVDGVTGQELRHAPVLALRDGVGGERVTAMGDDTKGDGSFHFEGLPPGTWRVAHLLSPQESVMVTVSEGAIATVRVETSDATALDENGFALAEEEGALVVQDVTPGSPADEAGLEPGEEVVGVLVGGFDVSSAMGDRGGDFARAVLGHWDGPGVTLVVETPEGEREEVPLEW